jgi:hypothetical protein
MSREYRIWVRADVVNREDALDIEEAVGEIWPMQDDHGDDGMPPRGTVYRVSLCGDGALTGGLTLDMLARQIQRKIWTRVQKYVDVSVSGVCLEPDEYVESCVLDFERDRDAKLLDMECCDCGDCVPFGSEGIRCAICELGGIDG